ncbi:MAG: sulfatase-like hydrolase/transferase [Sedimentisphaerales bacterium]|nr:sulfatase-like hydrolase/transferase [Sedimentisphaerales bacterium]
MNRRDFLKALSAAALVPACGPTQRLFAQDRKRTNFVFFLVDDLGWTDLGCFGSTFYETPHVDRLAAGSMRFTNAYAACPVCSPTRASIMTGKYPARLRTTDYFGAPQPDTVGPQWRKNRALLPARYRDRLPLEEVTLAEALKQHGYATFFAGKWHLGGEGFYPEDQGFDVNKGGIERGGPYGGKKYFSPYGNPRLPDGPAGEHLPDRLATETCRFIKANKDQPFLAYLAFYSVHTPLMARADLRAKYEKKAKSVDHEGPAWGKEGARKVRLVQDHAVYGGMVEAMDQAVGKVLDALDRLDLAENTVVFFMSDNGGLSTSEGHPTCNLPLRAGKGWLYEGGIREPMMVRWPGQIEAGGICHEPVISTDFYPTILEMAGVPSKPQQHLDGRSMVGLLRQRGPQEDRAIYWHYPHYGNQGGSPGGAIRLGDYKLIEFYEDNHIELYNLRDDIGEQQDLAAEKPRMAGKLRQMLHEWRDEVDAAMPSPNPNRKE